MVEFHLIGKLPVCPIFKKGDRKLPSNYRPVSLTSICGKVMESIISDSMIAFLRANHLLSDEQYGFLAKRSTCTQLLTTLNDFTLLADNKMRVDAVYIDFAKAFDSVSHSKLLLKATCMDLLLIYWIGYPLFSLIGFNVYIFMNLSPLYFLS